MILTNAETQNAQHTPTLPFALEKPDLHSKSEKAAALGVIALSLYSFLRNLAHADIKPLWFDELLTQAISRQAGFSGIWNALKSGSDGNPPFFYFIERAASRLASNEMIAFRLPSILAFSFTVICLYLFVQKRSGVRAGLTCAFLLFITPLNTLYAVEARPYSLLVASLAFAMLAYQRLPGAWWTIGLLVSLSLAESLHYYAGLACFSFFVAELVHIYSARRFRTWVWLSMFGSLIPAVLSAPLLLGLRRIYGTHFVARPELMLIPRSYGEYFRLDAMWGIAIAGIAALVVIAAWARASRQTADAPNADDVTPASEYALVLGFVALPAFGVVVARIAHGGAMDRYFLAAILGIAIAFGYVLNSLRPAEFKLIAAFVLIAVAAQEFGFFRLLLSSPKGIDDRADFLLPLLAAAHHNDLPVVISDAGQYVELAHAAPQSLNQRMVAFVDPANAVIYAQTDTVDRLVIRLNSYVPLRAYEFKPYAAEHPVFLLYSDGTTFDWWPIRLAHDGAEVEVAAKQGPGILYWVSLNPRQAASH